MSRVVLRAASVRNSAIHAGVIALALVSLASGAASTAQAGDVEYVGQGTRALGRGGAFAARADDAMALTYNPAALADLTNTQVMLNVHNAFYDSCVTREGTYGDQVPQDGTTDEFGDFASYRNTPFPRVCQNNRINPGLWLAAALRLNDRLGLGFGIMTPSAAAHLIWGDGEGAIKEGSLPSPVRYQLIEQDIKLVLPTLGLGYQANDWLRLGLSLQAGLALIKNINHTVLNGTENPSEDIRSELNVADYFIPAAIFSLHAVPHDNVDVVVYGRVSADIDAKGEVKVEGPAFSQALTRDSSDEATLTSPQPASFGLGFRYADRLAPRVEGERGDSMTTENWDLELDATYVMASQFDAISVDVPPLPRAGLPNGLEFDLVHEWQDQLSIKLGGDFNVVQDVLAVRAGVHYETSAISGSYMGVDFQPAQRFGLHTGLTYRVAAWDLSLAYAHIFQETVVVPLNAAAFRQIADRNPVVVNAGKYEAHYDVVSLGVTYRFGTTL